MRPGLHLTFSSFYSRAISVILSWLASARKITEKGVTFYDAMDRFQLSVPCPIERPLNPGGQTPRLRL
jgi:hypothetical protein